MDRAEDPAYIRVTVSDTGTGIPPGETPRIFEHLYQVKDASRKSRGLGLGLYLCKELVERQDGKIGVESRPGQGGAFFTMPVRA